MFSCLSLKHKVVPTGFKLKHPSILHSPLSNKRNLGDLFVTAEPVAINKGRKISGACFNFIQGKDAWL